MQIQQTINRKLQKFFYTISLQY